MFFIRERVGEIIRQLNAHSHINQLRLERKEGHFPITDKVENTRSYDLILKDLAGKNSAYFHLHRNRDSGKQDGMAVELSISTGREGEWDAANPQIAAYVNGILTQGMDVNHRELRFRPAERKGKSITCFCIHGRGWWDLSVEKHPSGCG